MSKKFYFDPEIEVIELKLEGALLSDSDGPGGINDDGSGNKGGVGDDGDF